MKYIHSWIFPLAVSLMVTKGLSEILPALAQWYFSLPLSFLFTMGTRGYLIDVYGTHVTYSFRLANRDESGEE